MRLHVLAACLMAASIVSAAAQPVRCAASWTGSAQGLYPVGNPSAQPDLRFAFPSAHTGARDQTMRLMVRPSLWGQQVRLRFSNALGTRPVTFDGVFAGLQRSGSVLDRDVLALSGITAVIWLEGIDDFGKTGNASAQTVIDGMKQGAARIRQRFPGVRVVGATVTTALGSSSPAHGSVEQDGKRRALNEFIRSGGPGEKLHLNRAGYEAMAATIELAPLVAGAVQAQ